MLVDQTGFAALQVIVLIGCLLTTSTVEGGEARAVTVSDGGRLHEALQDQNVSLIVLTGNVTVDSDGYLDQPVPVDRNVTITGLPGAYPVLDLNRQTAVVRLCGSCTLRIVNASIANATRQGVGRLTFFSGQSGSRIVLQNGYEMLLACPSPAAELAAANQTQRSQLFPHPRDGMQLAETANAPQLGEAGQSAFHSVDVSTDVPRSLITSNRSGGGFAVQYLNVTNVCWSRISDDCVAQNTLDACIFYQVQLLQDARAAAGQQPQGHFSAGQVAAIVVPVTVVGAVLVGVALWLLNKRPHCCRGLAAATASRHSRTDGNKYIGDLVVHAPSGTSFPPDSSNSNWLLPPASVRAAADSAAGAAAANAAAELPSGHYSTRSTPAGSSQPSSVATVLGQSGTVQPGAADDSAGAGRGSPGPFAGPSAPIDRSDTTTGGVSITSSETLPSLQAAMDAYGSAIQWGPLLGAGSFGRVFKCRWAGMDVAVKVIQHDAAALSTVVNEVQLQMHLQHPNVVRAFHYVTHTQQPSSISSSGTPATVKRSDGLPTAGGAASQASGMLHSSNLMSSTAAASFPGSTPQQPANLMLPLQQQLQRRQQQEQPQLQREHQVQVDPAEAALPAHQHLQPQPAQQQHQQVTQHSVNAPGMPGAQLATVSHTSPGVCVDSNAPDAATVPPAPGGSSLSSGAAAARQLSIKAGSSSSHCVSAAAPASEVTEASVWNTSSRSGPLLMSGNASSSHSIPLLAGAPPGWHILLLDSSACILAETQPTSPAAAAGGGIGGGGGSSSGGGGSGGSGGVRLAVPRQGIRAAEVSETWLVQEYCDCGTLASIAANYWSRDTEGDMQMLQRLLLLQDVASGLQFLHSRHVIHSDLNANNVLVSSSDTSINGLVAKIADLGLSRIISQQKSFKITHTMGMLSHMPPCLLREGRLSTAADVYAFAVMMYELFTQERAWQGLHYGQLLQQVVLEHSRPAIPRDMPADYADLMMRCWAEEPHDRPTADELLDSLQAMVEQRMLRLGATSLDDDDAAEAPAPAAVQTA